MALKLGRGQHGADDSILAVPSYGAMALKPLYCGDVIGTQNLAVPSYGAMALKPPTP